MTTRQRRHASRPGARPRFLSSRLTARQRRVYLAATGWFLLVSLGMTWPGYTLFNRIRPLVLGMPFSLFYLATLVVLSFAVGVALLVWELRNGLIDEPREGGG